MIIDEIVKKIKTDLPMLTNLFGVNLPSVSGIKIENSKAVITLSSAHNLKNEEKVYVQGVKLPIKVKSITLDTGTNYIVEFDFYHHLLSSKTTTVELYNSKNEKLTGEFTLNEDVNGIKLNIDLSLISGPSDLTDITDTYLIKSHNKIINGYREITVINDLSFSFDMNDNNEIFSYEVDITNFYEQCLTQANVSTGQRVFGCFDLQNAIESYCNLYNTTLESVTNSTEIQTKSENELTCYVELEKPVSNQSQNFGDCSGRQNYKFNIYLFFPLKKDSQLQKKYKVTSNILTITNNAINRILGNKQLDFDIGLISTKSFPIQYLGCQEAGNGNNVLYIHKISYGFTHQTYPEDFNIDYDYFRLNRLLFESYESSLDINY
jgi:hypothetical protein